MEKNEQKSTEIQESNKIPIVPGNRTYSSATKYGKKILIIGDSHLKKIRRNIFNDSLINCKSHIKPFGGAKTEHMKYYIIPNLKEFKPDIVVVNIGSNDINFQNLQIDLNKLSNEIINIGLNCFRYGVREVIISSILVKKSVRLSAMIRRVNDLLKELCETNNMIYMSNDFIDRDFLSEDGVHLTYYGIRNLAGNFVDTINDIVSSQNNIGF